MGDHAILARLLQIMERHLESHQDSLTGQPEPIVSNPKYLGVNVKAWVVIEGVLHVQNYFNVTEIHYNYGDLLGNLPMRVAFESDVHGTGCTLPLKPDPVFYLREFETTPATEIAESF